MCYSLAETLAFRNCLKLEKGEMLPDIIKSISKITFDLVLNEPLLKELGKD